MTITLLTLRALQSPAGAALLAELAEADLSEANTLRLLTDLRKRHPPEIASAALEMARLRIKAREKFGERAARMFFTREALEQATDSRISRYRFQPHDVDDLIAADFGCSIGGDTMALAEAGGALVAGVDLDPVRLAMAQANVTSERAVFIQADLLKALPFAGRLAFAFFDPARRADDGQRIYSVKDYIPPLSVIQGWRGMAVSVKLSPGIDLDEIKEYGSIVEFISLKGELKEAVLHLSGGAPFDAERRATLIDESGTYAQIWRNLLYGTEPTLNITEPRAVLYEPDPAVIRAGLVQDLGAELDATLIDSTIAYLTSDQAVQMPFARAWQIEDWMPFNLKRLRAYLRERGIGRVTVKKRGSPITPEELIAKLHLPGKGEERIVVLTRVKGNPAILICQTRQ